MTPFKFYLLTRADALKEIFFWLSIVWFLIFILSCVEPETKCDKNNSLRLKFVFVSLLFMILSFIAHVLAPTTKELAFIFVVPKIADSDFVSKAGNDFKNIEDLAADYQKEKLTEGK